jgi:transposase
MAPACDLIKGLPAGDVLADKAYDANRLHDLIIAQGGDPVIPPRRHRKRQHGYDKGLYKERNRVERFFSRIKQCRRIATRYDKLAETFMGFVKLACIMLWRKHSAWAAGTAVMVGRQAAAATSAGSREAFQFQGSSSSIRCAG